MEEILKNAKSMPNSRLYLNAEAVQTVETGYGPIPPAIMDQLAAAAAAQYVGQQVGGVPPGQQPPGPHHQHQQHAPPPPPPSQPTPQLPRTNVTDAAVQTDVTTVVQSKQYLRRHVRIHTGERPYRCVVCQLSFRRSHHLRRHELMHTDIRPFACHNCDKAFKQKQHLERHLASHTDLRAYACAICEKAFKQKQHLDRHLQCHSDLRAYPCSLCDKAFKQKQHLDRHLHCHSDLKPFVCSLCQKAFKQKQHLDRHLQCHSDIKPYACNLCEKAFKQKQHLDRHLLSHTGEKPFACHMCEKAFTRKQHLDRHIKMHTGELERTYKCHVCEKMFFRSHHRDKHMKSHGITALETKNRPMNFQLMNMDVKVGPGETMNPSSPHSPSSDSGSDTDDDHKPPISDKPNSQVSKMVEGCRKRKTHSPVRLPLGTDKKGRIAMKANAGSNTTPTPTPTEANGQQTPNLNNQRSFDYSGMRNDVVFPRNEAVMSVRDGGTNTNNGTLGQSASGDGGLHAHLANNGQGLDASQHGGGQTAHQQQQFMNAMNMGLTTAQLQQLQQMSAVKMDSGTQHQDNGPAKTPQPQPLIVPSSHFTSTSKVELQPKYTSAAAAIAGRQQQQGGGVGVGVMDQSVHLRPVVGTQSGGGTHQAWPPALNWPPRLSLMPDGSLQGVPALTTYPTVNMADLNQVSGAAMYSAQRAVEMRMAGLHRSPSLAGDTWVPVSGAERDGQQRAPSANDRRIYSPQPNT